MWVLISGSAQFVILNTYKAIARRSFARPVDFPRIAPRLPS